MAMAVVTAADILKNQNVRDASIKVEFMFQRMSQTNSRLPKALTGATSVKTDVDALCTALVAAGAITSFVS